jgi:transposase
MSIVEQRYQAVLAVLAGDPMTEVAAKARVSRNSLHTWLRRYAEEGLTGLQVERRACLKLASSNGSRRATGP